MARAGERLRCVGDLLTALVRELGLARAQVQLRDASEATPLGPPRSDTRAVREGDCFIALRGLTRDAHDLVPKALEAGAGLLVLERELDGAHGHARLLVPDTRAVLPVLAAGWQGWPGDALALAGITGTNGKTSVAHLVGSVLTTAGLPHLRLGTTGNWLVDREIRAGFTTPFPVELQALLHEARERGATHGVMEVSSHALVQGRARPLRFRAVALTSFSQDHLDFHGTMEAYLAAKCELARHACHREGVALAPMSQGEASDHFLAAAREAGVARRWRCAREDRREADLAVVARSLGQQGFCGRMRTPIGELELRTGLVGEHNLDNLLTAVGVGVGLGLSLDQLAAGLYDAVGAPGRLEPVRLARARGQGTSPLDDPLDDPLVYVDYAHTPDAVARVLEALRPIASERGGKLVVLVGCGGDRDPSKRPLMGAFASRGADRFYATSDNPRSEDPAAIVEQMLAGRDASGAELIRELDRATAIARAIAEAAPADVVLLAGKGHEDYQIIGEHKLEFDDREHAAAALARRSS